MKKSMIILCLPLFLIMSSCEAPVDNSLTETDIEYFENFLPEIAKAWNEGDREPYIQGSINAAYMLPNGETLNSENDIRSFVDGFPECTTEYSDFEIIGNQGLVSLRGKFLINDMEGGIIDKGKFITLYQKSENGKWEQSHAIWNSDLPLPVAEEGGEEHSEEGPQ
jgi:hypothetical protein